MRVRYGSCPLWLLCLVHSVLFAVSTHRKVRHEKSKQKHGWSFTSEVENTTWQQRSVSPKTSAMPPSLASTMPQPQTTAISSKTLTLLNFGKKINGNYTKMTDLLNSLFKHYDNRIRPGFGGPPLVVKSNIAIRSLSVRSSPVSRRSSFQMDCYFRQSWYDTRLQFEGDMERLSLNNLVLQKMWKPDTYILNGGDSHVHTITVPNKLVRIYKDGRILYSMRVSFVANCPMQLQKYPLDLQACPIEIGSFGYSTRDIVYQWTTGDEESINLEPDVELSQFDLKGFVVFQINETLPYDIRSRLKVVFNLERRFGYYMINIYFPSLLVTATSWVAFFIHKDASAARVNLGITTVLTMTTLSMVGREDLPRVPYPTALDVYFMFCFMTVFAALCEYAAVNYYAKVKSAGEPKKSEQIAKQALEAKLAQEAAEAAAAAEAENAPVEFQEMRRVPPREGLVEPIPIRCETQQTEGLLKNDRRRLSGGKGFGDKLRSCWKRVQCCCRRRQKKIELSLPTAPKEEEEEKDPNAPCIIDIYARVIFPSIFVGFNIIYWVAYTYYF